MSQPTNTTSSDTPGYDPYKFLFILTPPTMPQDDQELFKCILQADAVRNRVKLFKGAPKGYYVVGEGTEAMLYGFFQGNDPYAELEHLRGLLDTPASDRAAVTASSATWSPGLLPSQAPAPITPHSPKESGQPPAVPRTTRTGRPSHPFSPTRPAAHSAANRSGRHDLQDPAAGPEHSGVFEAEGNSLVPIANAPSIRDLEDAMYFVTLLPEPSEGQVVDRPVRLPLDTADAAIWFYGQGYQYLPSGDPTEHEAGTTARGRRREAQQPPLPWQQGNPQPVRSYWHQPQWQQAGSSHQPLPPVGHPVPPHLWPGRPPPFPQPPFPQPPFPQPPFPQPPFQQPPFPQPPVQQPPFHQRPLQQPPLHPFQQPYQQPGPYQHPYQQPQGPALQLHGRGQSQSHAAPRITPAHAQTAQSQGQQQWPTRANSGKMQHQPKQEHSQQTHEQNRPLQAHHDRGEGSTQPQQPQQHERGPREQTPGAWPPHLVKYTKKRTWLPKHSRADIAESEIKLRYMDKGEVWLNRWGAGHEVKAKLPSWDWVNNKETPRSLPLPRILAYAVNSKVISQPWDGNLGLAVPTYRLPFRPSSRRRKDTVTLYDALQAAKQHVDEPRRLTIRLIHPLKQDLCDSKTQSFFFFGIHWPCAAKYGREDQPGAVPYYTPKIPVVPQSVHASSSNAGKFTTWTIPLISMTLLVPRKGRSPSGKDFYDTSEKVWKKLTVEFTNIPEDDDPENSSPPFNSEPGPINVTLDTCSATSILPVPGWEQMRDQWFTGKVDQMGCLLPTLRRSGTKIESCDLIFTFLGEGGKTVDYRCYADRFFKSPFKGQTTQGDFPSLVKSATSGFTLGMNFFWTGFVRLDCPYLGNEPKPGVHDCYVRLAPQRVIATPANLEEEKFKFHADLPGRLQVVDPATGTSIYKYDLN